MRSGLVSAFRCTKHEAENDCKSVEKARCGKVSNGKVSWKQLAKIADSFVACHVHALVHVRGKQQMCQCELSSLKKMEAHSAAIG